MSNDQPDNEYKYGLDWEPGATAQPQKPAPVEAPESPPQTPTASTTPEAQVKPDNVVRPTDKTGPTSQAAPAPKKLPDKPRKAPKEKKRATTSSDKETSPKKKAQQQPVFVPKDLIVHATMVLSLVISFSISNQLYNQFAKFKLEFYQFSVFMCNHYQQQVKADEQQGYERSLLYARHCNNLGNFYQSLGEQKLAEPWVKKSFEIKLNAPHVAWKSMIDSLENLGMWYDRAGDKASAEVIARALVEAKKKHDPKQFPSETEDLIDLLLEEDRIDDAKKLFYEMRNNVDTSKLASLPAMRAEYSIHLKSKQFTQASNDIEAMKKSFRENIGERSLDEDSAGNMQFYEMEARLESARGNHQKAVELAKDELRCARLIKPAESASYAIDELKMSRIFFVAGDFQETEKLLSSALPTLDRSALCRPAIIKGWERYKESLEKNGKPELAQKAGDKLLELKQCREERDQKDPVIAEVLKTQIEKALTPPSSEIAESQDKSRKSKSKEKVDPETDEADRAPYSIPLLLVLIFWLIFTWKINGNIAGYLASLKGRSHQAFFIVGLFLGPLGWLIAALIPSKKIHSSLSQKQKLAGKAHTGFWIGARTARDAEGSHRDVHCDSNFAYAGNGHYYSIRGEFARVACYACIGTIVGCWIVVYSKRCARYSGAAAER